MNIAHATDLKSDRALGGLWERNFASLCARYHPGTVSLHQIGRNDGAASARTYDGSQWHRLVLPDITIWTAPGEHHEIKHKRPTEFGCYGLEEYRLGALYQFARETGQPVLYTIHDWERAGAAHSRADMPNRLEDWVTVEIGFLYAERHRPQVIPTWRNGKKEQVPGYYWSVDLWMPLGEWWNAAELE